MRVVVRVLLLASLFVIAAVPASAAKPARGCGNEGFVHSSKAAFRDLSRGLGVPEVLLGAPLDAWWGETDKNGNDHLCVKDLPNTPGLPVIVFNIVDDTANR
jgi:hypothetical protein